MGEKNNDLELLRCAVSEVVNGLDADIILYSGGIFPPGDSKLIQLVRSFKKRKNILFHLTTGGGDPDTAYRIARCLQRAYQDGQFILFVDSYCKSAGTLIALGADQIVMSSEAEFGPLDVQLSKPDALAEQTSGLTPTHAINTLRERAFESLEETFLALRFRSGLQITTRTALEIATELTQGLFSPIFAQIDPMRLGEISRAMLIANKYGSRLAKGNEQSGALQRLIEDYPSHSFVIDRQETEQLFRCVRNPDAAEATLARMLEPYRDEGLKSKEPLVEFLSVLVESDEDQEVRKGANCDESNNGPEHLQTGPGDASDPDATKGSTDQRESPRDEPSGINPSPGAT